MPGVSVVIPYRGDDGGHRDRALAWVLRRWEAQHPAWQVAIGYCPPGPWRKGIAVADALTRCDGDIVVVADADVWCDGVAAAVDAVATGAPWAIPHNKVRRLTAVATAAVLAGGRPGLGDAVLDEPAYRGLVGGGMVAAPRDVHLDIPMDTRFAGWGQEDEAWAGDLDAVAGPAWRGTADMWHLWHPPQQRESRRWGSPMNRALLREHLVARQRGETRALLAGIRDRS